MDVPAAEFGSGASGGAVASSSPSASSSLSISSDSKSEVKGESSVSPSPTPAPSPSSPPAPVSDDRAERLRKAQSAALAALSAPHREVVDQLMAKFGPQHELARDPIFIIRFATARNFDLTKATEMLDNHFKWRAANLPVPYAEVYPELKKGKWFVRGHDKAGRPLVFVRGRYFDPDVRDLRTAVRAIVYCIEEAISRMEPGNTMATILYDRSDYSRKNMDMEFIRALGRECSDNYPETLHICFITPAGIMFRSLWAMASVFFDKKTRGKVIPLAGFQQWLDHIDKDQLPVYYGGTDPWEWKAELLPLPNTTTPTSVSSSSSSKTPSSSSDTSAASPPSSSSAAEVTPAVSSDSIESKDDSK